MNMTNAMHNERTDVKKTPTWVLLLATWFYLGKFPKAPGTIGTLGAIPLVIGLSFLGSLGYMFGAIILTLFSVFVAELYERTSEKHDAKEVVIDEVVGYVVAMTWLPLTWQSFLVAFLLFRFFDILKPPPIGTIDKRIEGGLGVVADDILAGVVTNFILQVVYMHTNWLGAQLPVYGVS